ncbi:hypothetical protein EVAR_56667_1 [Eumeta japonica]|uniref:Uncharacterized protein n=1 Tax=Eumeta variegata TaxID=151549 RepID=A0A4C1YYT7_EUMVA|nr:hypothetical protein EVAR_56667_1 [Eumeta japonica]
MLTIIPLRDTKVFICTFRELDEAKAAPRSEFESKSQSRPDQRQSRGEIDIKDEVTPRSAARRICTYAYVVARSPDGDGVRKRSKEFSLLIHRNVKPSTRHVFASSRRAGRAGVAGGDYPSRRDTRLLSRPD